ncbi:MAG: hypothetical protein JKY26_17555 [Pseudomonas sp.]|nr:hypothetical protein [Pseudomonas sp.]
MSTQPCNIYLHPTVACNQAAINAIVARTGLAVVVGTNRAALSLVDRKPAEGFTLDFPSAFRSIADDLPEIGYRPALPNRLEEQRRSHAEYMDAEAIARANRFLRVPSLLELCTRAGLNDPGNGGWIGDDPDPFDGGGRAA